MILVFGKNGQLGSELVDTLRVFSTVIGIDRSQVDLTDLDSIKNTLNLYKPKIIINAAAYTNVKQAEVDNELAIKINGYAPMGMADIANDLGATLIHFSTDYVYDGRKGAPYVETDKPNPLNNYGESKLLGDKLVHSLASRHYIFRTSWVAGANGTNFVTAILKQACLKPELEVVDDQFGNPTPVAELVRATTYSILTSKGRAPYGIYHVCGAGATNWFEYAKVILQMAQKANYPLKSTSDCVIPIKTSDQGVERPMNSELNTAKFEREFTKLCPWEDDLEEMVWRLKDKIVQNL